MLSSDVIKALRAEATRMRAQANLIDQFLRGLDANRETQLANIRLERPTLAAGGQSKSGSFSAQIRSALQNVGHVATARQVADEMIQSGCPPERNGKPLRERISVELFRMARRNTGGVRKVRRGAYRLETNGS